jgi:hypothetical protein
MVEAEQVRRAGAERLVPDLAHRQERHPPRPFGHAEQLEAFRRHLPGPSLVEEVVEQLPPPDALLHDPHVVGEVDEAQETLGHLHDRPGQDRGDLTGPPGQGQPEAHLALDEDGRGRHLQPVRREDVVAAAAPGDLVPDGADRHRPGVGHHSPAGPEEDGATDDRGQPADEGLLRPALAHRPKEGVLQRHRPLERGEVVTQVGPVDEGDDVPERDLQRHLEDREVAGPGLLE